MMIPTKAFAYKVRMSRAVNQIDGRTASVSSQAGECVDEVRGSRKCIVALKEAARKLQVKLPISIGTAGIGPD